MNKVKTAVTLLIGWVAVLPTLSLAYMTTNQTVTALQQNTILYSIEYKFGMNQNDLRLPILAERGLTFGTKSPNVGYELVYDDASYVEGNAIGLVVSDARIVNNKYFVPRGESRTFTLYVLATLPYRVSTTSPENVALQMTSLPFTIVTTDDELSNHLNQSELSYYVTPEFKAP